MSLFHGNDRSHVRSARRVAVAALLGTVCLVPALAQDANLCDEPGDSPDVIVGDLPAVNRYGTIGGITAFSVATTSCNIGTCQLNWIAEDQNHPTIAQHMYRLSDGRFEQVGQSWLKHGFFALSQELCNTGCIGTNGDWLGVNCSDPYSAGLNGSQGGLGPKFEVNASNGVFPYPATDLNQTGNAIYKRLQVANDDLDPALNPGALYWVEGHYIAQDDAIAGNGNNNASHRPVNVTGSDGFFDANVTGSTIREEPAIMAWKDNDPDVVETIIGARDGRLIVAARAYDLGGGQWNYEYAVHNLNSDVSIGGFTIPVTGAAEPINIGFHDVPYHSGEIWDGTDWGVTQTADSVSWATEDWSLNPNANALRWGTTYNFRFDATTPPVTTTASMTSFKPGGDGILFFSTIGPDPCDNDGFCEAGEDCNNCSNDCEADPGPPGICGDGICDPGLGEDCVSCEADCNGVQGGNPGGRFCCGDGDGQNPVGCNDNRCTQGPLECGNSAMPTCCGDGACEGVEDSCGCGVDCGFPTPSEIACGDASDDDCDGLTDCNDLDCCTDGLCLDGIDADLDGVAECDCDDDDGSIWGTPGEALDLRLDGTGSTDLAWNPPVEIGGVTVEYEALRSSNRDEFGGTAQCVPLADPEDTFTVDATSPSNGSMFYYLIRAENTCPFGAGSLGEGAGMDLRDGRTCP